MIFIILRRPPIVPSCGYYFDYQDVYTKTLGSKQVHYMPTNVGKDVINLLRVCLYW